MVFRADASEDIGTGHVMRCLTLANALKKKGAECLFICRDHVGSMRDRIERERFEAIFLPTITTNDEHSVTQGLPAHAAWLGCDWELDAYQTIECLSDKKPDWLVADHYALGRDWEMAVREHVKKIMVIDDLADREHDCDLLLDQNLGRNAGDHAKLVPDHCKILAGPKYAILRPEFAALREYSLERRKNPQIKQILISMGGIDQDNATGRVLAALQDCTLPRNCRIVVVMGRNAPWLKSVQKTAEDLPWTNEVLVDINDMAQRMADSDLAIGAAGVTSWERCCLGLPTLLVTVAENQFDRAEALARSGCVKFLGSVSEIEANLVDATASVVEANSLISAISRSSAITDGLGTGRVIEEVLSSIESGFVIRRARREDEMLLLDWVNDKLSRMNSFNVDTISLATHRSWFESRLNSPESCCIYIVECQRSAIGQARFEVNDKGAWEIDYAVAPEYRGQGLAKKLLRSAIEIFHQEHRGVTIIGKVKRDNEPSCRVFEALNFGVQRNENSGVNVYTCALA